MTQVDGDFDCDRFVELPKYKLISQHKTFSTNKNDNQKYNLIFKKLKINYNAESLYLKLLKSIR